MRIYIPRPLRWTAALVVTFLPLSASAVTFSLDNINLGDVNALVDEFSANSQYDTVTPASSLGGLGGFELGLAAGQTKAPETLALVKKNAPGTTLKGDLYHAGALARLGLPYGLTGEFLYIPKVKISEAHLKRWGVGLQWTLTDHLLDELPLHLAFKGYYTKTAIDYSQTIQNSSTLNIPVSATIALESGIWGGMAIASYKLLVFEPFVGFGWAKAKGTLNVDAAGNATIFNTTVFAQGTKSITSSPSSSQLMAGMDVRLAFFSLGADYLRGFGKTSYNGRVSFRF